MFGLGFTEILVILIVEFIFTRPKDIPRLFTKLGRIYGQFTRQLSAAKRIMGEFEDEVRRAGELESRRDGDDTRK